MTSRTLRRTTLLALTLLSATSGRVCAQYTLEGPATTSCGAVVGALGGGYKLSDAVGQATPVIDTIFYLTPGTRYVIEQGFLHSSQLRIQNVTGIAFNVLCPLGDDSLGTCAWDVGAIFNGQTRVQDLSLFTRVSNHSLNADMQFGFEVSRIQTDDGSGMVDCPSGGPDCPVISYPVGAGTDEVGLWALFYDVAGAADHPDTSEFTDNDRIEWTSTRFATYNVDGNSGFYQGLNGSLVSASGAAVKPFIASAPTQNERSLFFKLKVGPFVTPAMVAHQSSGSRFTVTMSGRVVSGPGVP